MMTNTNIRLFGGQDCGEMIFKLQDAMANNKTVSSLEIRETALDDDMIDSVVSLLSRGSVETIHLEDCSAHLNKSVVRLVEALGNCEDVRLSEFTFLSRFFFETFLGSATKLKSLRIRDHLFVEQIVALSRGLAINRILHTLDLSYSRIDDFSILAEGLKGCCAKRLGLRSIGLRDDHLGLLMAALDSSAGAVAQKLESLDLSFNRLRNPSCIGDFLRSPDCHLRELLIGYQNLWQADYNGKNVDVTKIAQSLAVNTSLRTLGLRQNELGDTDALELATALEENFTLETLDLGENNVSDPGVLALANTARSSSRGLQRLNLRRNQFGTKASLALLEAASTNFRLLTIDSTDERRGRNIQDERIHRQIRYHTALNRGGRELLLWTEGPPPQALWPLVLAKQAPWPRRDETNGGNNRADCSSKRTSGLDDMRIDVLYYLLKESPTTFFLSQKHATLGC
mmetsp:Transcript_21948/g.46292  ORF Transcript_21948/g.46292 Transcript_21948/m.46292 type:complete len:456 (-) Transcript_21948:248-1615(-)|eukprot:CAMPEP_0201185918 /NCGR_PEP_ID=MMETSP0851-20130426/130024_1 /ASSEMBLY_ACC=CAM_ASM_000631 /TAXON_ID=183588 /ORGANISM="Pseudo-nitzschia fraudulenta, Strain WWA7" /LENGTH=455 /DNA_ID=CAMNT_0047471155 /DNA_START=17 /DNA_END=1384 /DNA_ORIENTATION=-